jgi:outer membrane lipoprotein-sorting protein
MRRRASEILVALLLLAAARAAAAQSVDDIVTQHLNAIGGLAKLQSISSIRQTSEMSREGNTMTVVIASKRPNLARQEMTIQGKTIVQVFDGTSAWMINPFTGSSEPAMLTGPEADLSRDQATFDSPLVDYKARGTTVELVATEGAAGKKVHHLKVTSKSGRVQDIYLDAVTGLQTRVVTQTPQGVVDQVFSDFKDVDGVKMPFTIRTQIGTTGTIDIKVLKAEINPPLDDSLFKVKSS